MNVLKNKHKNKSLKQVNKKEIIGLIAIVIFSLLVLFYTLYIKSYFNSIYVCIFSYYAIRFWLLKFED